MEIYRPQPNKIQTLSQDNPRYWAILTECSRYSEAEISQTLADIEAVNDELHTVLTEGYGLLVDEDGPMDWITGFASDEHEVLSVALSEAAYASPGYSDNGHLDCLPVRKWQRDVKATHRDIKKVRKAIAAVQKNQETVE